jgi:hypothetical protein
VIPIEIQDSMSREAAIQPKVMDFEASRLPQRA